jgi:hypothetical protein
VSAPEKASPQRDTGDDAQDTTDKGNGGTTLTSWLQRMKALEPQDEVWRGSSLNGQARRFYREPLKPLPIAQFLEEFKGDDGEPVHALPEAAWRRIYFKGKK